MLMRNLTPACRVFREVFGSSMSSHSPKCTQTLTTLLLQHPTLIKLYCSAPWVLATMPAKRWSIWQITFCQLIIVRPEGPQLYHHERAEPFVELHACKLALRNSGCGTRRLQPHRPQAQPHSAREWGRFATKSRTRPGRLSKKRKLTTKKRSPRSSTRTQKGASCSTILTHSLCILETLKRKISQRS